MVGMDNNNSITGSKDNTGSLSTASKVVAIIAIGIIAGFLAVSFADTTYRRVLTEKINTISGVIDSKKIASLKDPESTKRAQDYSYVRSKLASAKNANSGTRFVYIMAKNDKGVYFLADSEPIDSEDYSPLGQEFPEASQNFQKMFENEKSLIEGPVKDRWGTWLSVLTPVYDSSGEMIAVVGIDIPAKEYIVLLLVVAIVPIGVAVAVSVIVIIGSRIRKRRLESLLFRSELISIASHELNTPLTGIRWGAESVLRNQLDDSQRRLVQSIYNSALKLQDSIDDILQLARLQNNSKKKISLVPNDISQIFVSVFSMQKLPADQKNISLKFGSSWPQYLSIYCNDVQLRRVFNNIISNGIKYAPENTSIVVGYQKTKRGHVISISDHGIGIPKSEQAKVFSGFYRASNAIKEGIDGTGMGLYLSRSIIEHHGGKLWLESAQDKGTTFFIQLPD